MGTISPLKILSVVFAAIGVACTFASGIVDKRVQDQTIHNEVAKAILESTKNVGG